MRPTHNRDVDADTPSSRRSGDAANTLVTTTDDNPLTLSLDPRVAARFNLAVSRKGMSVERNCREVIESELARDEEERGLQAAQGFDIEGLIEFRTKMFGDRVFPGDSVELIQEAREKRTAQMEEW